MIRNIHNEPIVKEQQWDHRRDIIRYGFYTLIDTLTGRILGGLMFILLMLGWVERVTICDWIFSNTMAQMMLKIYPIVFVPVSIAILLLFLVALSRPWYYNKVLHNMIRAGVVNKAGEPPILIRHYKADFNSSCTVWKFRACGIPLGHWIDSQMEIQSALNVNVVDIREDNDRRTILLFTVSPLVSLDEDIPWMDNYTDKDEASIILGRGFLGDVKVNINKMPHFLIGGSTGSGKSVLLKVIIWQAILRNGVVIIADFKGGVDFGSEYHQYCTIITDEAALLVTLTELIEVLEGRKMKLKQVGAHSITEYRSRTGIFMKRIFIACDELAELMDKIGADKERKELLSKIEIALSTIARQGRAFGIHLVLATQRPDANVLPGQIKSNLDVRICGKVADPVLSTIIIGDGRAHEIIPKHIQGRFMLDDGTVFQGYYRT